MKIEYTKVGDYYLPNLYYPEETRPIGLWGMLRKEYLKEHKSGTYTYLLLTARLDSYLADLNEQAQERFELIETQMRSAEGLTENSKSVVFLAKIAAHASKQLMFCLSSSFGRRYLNSRYSSVSELLIVVPERNVAPKSLPVRS